MSDKLKLQLSAPVCNDPLGGVYAMVDITFNDVVLAEDVQLTASTQTVEYDVTVLTSGTNVLNVEVTNAVAEDTNADGDMLDVGETTTAIIEAVDYSLDDGSTWVNLLPQSAVSHTIPSGANVGTVLELLPAITDITSYGACLVKFTTAGGLVNSDNVTAIQATVDGSGDYWNAVTGDQLAN